MSENKIMRKNLIKKIKNVLKERILEGGCGIFDCRGWTPDPKCTIFNEDGVIVDICHGYEYFEILGLTDEEFKLVADYYQKLLMTTNKA